MNDQLDQIPPGHGEGPVGAIPEAETMALALADPSRPPLVPPIADALGLCPRCWYGHGPDEECRR